MSISHFTGGNTMQPPEPMLSRAEWEQVYGVSYGVAVERPPVPQFSEWTVSQGKRVHAAHVERARAFLAISDQPYPDDWRVVRAVGQVAPPDQRRRPLTGIVKSRIDATDARRSLLRAQREEACHISHKR